MKILITATSFLLVMLMAGCGRNTVRISGKIDNPVKDEYLYLAELKANRLETADSVKLDESGDYSFEREINAPVFYLLKFTNDNFFTFLAEPGDKIEINARYATLGEPTSITGSKSTEKLIEYNKAFKRTIAKLRGLYDIYSQNADSPDLDKVMQIIDSTAQNYISEINAYTKEFIDNNMGSLVTLITLYQQVAPNVYVLDPVKDIKYFMKVDSALTKRYPSSEPVQALHEQVAALTESLEMAGGKALFLDPGTEAPEITLPSPDGKMISLSSTRGDIVLLDFWAAWCPPCRQENPNLVKAYDMYRDKGFQIFQVSLDRTREAWLSGIKEDNLERWIHVSDLKYWNSSVVSQYRIESIPHNLLLDRDGKIIALDLRGPQLQAKLAELFRQ